MTSVLSESADQDDSFERLATQLIAEFTPPLPAEEVRRCVADCAAMYHSAPVRTYLGLLVEREARTQLRILAPSRSGSAQSQVHIEIPPHH